MINALEIPLETDLADFSRFLRARGVRHRVAEDGLNQVIWVGTEMEAELVRASFARFQAGELEIEPPAVIPTFRPMTGFVRALRRFPMTIALILINVVCFPIGMGAQGDELGPLFQQMMFLKLEMVGGDLYFTSLASTLESGEFWRLLTPMLIHFSWLHIVFNLLWVWEIGRRIEAESGAAVLLLVTLFTSLCANLLQYLMSGPGFFGGMSGVVFGLLGHTLVWGRIVPLRSMGVPPGIYIFMLIYLVIGFTGAIDLLGLGSLANGAHLGGLLGGLATGGLAGLLAHRRLHRPR